MVVLLSAPRGRISAARMLAHRSEADQACGIVIRPSRGDAPAPEPAPVARPRVAVGGVS